MNRHPASVSILLAVGMLACLAPGTQAAITGYAAMGASDTAGTTYTGSWVPYLANQRGFDFGPSMTYNVAVGGARSDTLLTQGQHTAVQSLVQNGDVDLAYLMIGGNDFLAVRTSIANGSLTGATLTAWAQGVVDNIGVAMDTVLSANPQGMVVAGLPDIGLTAAGQAAFTTSVEFQRIADAADVVNGILQTEVLARGQVFVDTATAMRDLNQGPLIVGGVTIDTVNASADPTHFFQDVIHPAAVGNGLTANLFLQAVNIGYGTNYALLTDLEILTTAGLAASFTGETSSLPYSNYIVTPVPEPSTWCLMLTAPFAIGLLKYRSRRRAS
ncbi:MAG: GDSL-type esterase/lipase family protein [Pirellulales bacterium]